MVCERDLDSSLFTQLSDVTSVNPDRFHFSIVFVLTRVDRLLVWC